MHGGLSPDLNSMEQIRRVMRPTDVSIGLVVSRGTLISKRPDSAYMVNPLTSIDPRLRLVVRLALVRS